MNTDGPTEADWQMVRDLIAAGWRSTSNAYHTVKLVKVPAFEEAIHFADGTPEWLRKEVRDNYTRLSERHWPRSGEGEERTLTPAQFRAFKMAGGRTA